VFASFYGASLDDALASSTLPADALAIAEESMAGALGVAAQLPGAMAADVITIAQEAFISGLSAGSLIAAAIAGAGAVAAAVWLPARHSRMRQLPVSTSDVPDTDDNAERISSDVKA
jgi:hypothetical protein